MNNLFENDDYCFVCGKSNPIGLKARVWNREGKALIDIKIPREYQGYRGVIHGGILSTLLDEAMIYAASSISAKAVTAKIEVKFLKPVLCEREIVVMGEVVKRKKNWVIAEGRIQYKGEKEDLCKGQALIKIWEA